MQSFGSRYRVLFSVVTGIPEEQVVSFCSEDGGSNSFEISDATEVARNRKLLQLPGLNSILEQDTINSFHILSNSSYKIILQFDVMDLKRCR
jgi:hypothetical protein